ncbi:hypothetical protein ABZX95_38945 [Streptomyces sp. NPDC004232]|uniref:hypothetical protein n=1 Tax=Streptomyces sp. NPDC004232 TaxID=3154454 RepID=UPI00339FB6C3
MSDSNPLPEPDQDNAQAVERPGLIEVHPGDRVVSALGSQAAVSVRSGTEIHYYFPIHVVLTGDVAETAKKDIASSIWNALYKALS